MPDLDTKEFSESVRSAILIAAATATASIKSSQDIDSCRINFAAMLDFVISQYVEKLK